MYTDGEISQNVRLSFRICRSCAVLAKQTGKNFNRLSLTAQTRGRFEWRCTRRAAPWIRPIRRASKTYTSCTLRANVRKQINREKDTMRCSGVVSLCSHMMQCFRMDLTANSRVRSKRRMRATRGNGMHSRPRKSRRDTQNPCLPASAFRRPACQSRETDAASRSAAAEEAPDDEPVFRLRDAGAGKVIIGHEK